MDLVLFQVVNGLIWGLILALVALGLSLVYGILNVVNIAHGSLYMLGAVFAWTIISSTASFWVALVMAPILVGLVGMAMELLVLRRIADNPLLSILATLGLLMMLQDGVLATFGGDLERIEAPIAGGLRVLMWSYPTYRVFVAVCSIVIILGFSVFLQHTRYGRWIRAVKQDAGMATAVGIPVPIVRLVAIALGGVFAGLGGVLSGPIVVVEYQMGLKMLATAFIVVVVGGFGSLAGSVVAATLFGLLEGVFAGVLPSTEAKIVTLILMSLMVLWRPEGILRKRVESVG